MCNNKPHDWARLKHDTDIRSSFVTEVKNRFSTLQEIQITALSANTRYNNFVKACKCNSVNPKLKKRLPWETLYIYQKRELIYQTAELKNSDPSQQNIKHFIEDQNVLTNTYEREQ